MNSKWLAEKAGSSANRFNSKPETSADARHPHLLSASVSHRVLNSLAENEVAEIKFDHSLVVGHQFEFLP
jgi:hypothetical protein